jgi:hypothetical protein
VQPNREEVTRCFAPPVGIVANAKSPIDGASKAETIAFSAVLRVTITSPSREQWELLTDQSTLLADRFFGTDEQMHWELKRAYTDD